MERWKAVSSKGTGWRPVPTGNDGTRVLLSRTQRDRSDLFDVVQGYLGGWRDYPKWVLIPSSLHTPADAAAALASHGF